MIIRLKLEYVLDHDEFPIVIQTMAEHVDINIMDVDTAGLMYEILCKHLKYIKCDLGEYDE